MRIDRTIAAAVTVAAALLIGGGTALAGQASDDTRAARCQELLERIAERRGISVAQLEAQIRARAQERINAALAAGKITAEQAARLETRLASGLLCKRSRAAAGARLGTRGMLQAAATYLGFTRAELRSEVRGTSLAALAQAQGKTVEGLETAMLARASAHLQAKVGSGRITQARANRILERLERRVDRLVERIFPAG